MARSTSLLLLSLLLAAPTTGYAQVDWDENKGDCESVLRKGSLTNVPRIKQCTELWESYRDITSLRSTDKRSVAKGFSVLYYKSSGADRSLAEGALRRLGMRPLPKAEALGSGARKASRSGRRVEAPPKYYPEVSRGRQREARSLVKKGLKLHKRKTGKAIKLYERAMRADPNYLAGYYNAACAYGLKKDLESAVEVLQEIKSRKSREGRNLLKKARTDRDFRYIKRRVEYKQATGFAEIVLLNGSGAEGKPHIKRLKRLLRNAHRSPAFVGTDENSRGTPMVWYKPGLEEVGEELKKLIDPEKTRLKVIDFNTAIDRYNFDVYVIWGMPHKTKLLALPELPDWDDAGGGAGGDESDPLKAIEDAKKKAEEAGGVLEAPKTPSFP